MTRRSWPTSASATPCWRGGRTRCRCSRNRYATNPDLPGTYRIGLFLYHYAHGRYTEALAEARQVCAPQVLYGHVAVAVAAAELGLDDEAAEHWRRSAPSTPTTAPTRSPTSQAAMWPPSSHP